MKTNEEFDDILSDALAEYREAEPLAGLEDRVLERVRERSERRRAWWRWGFAAVTVVALIVALCVGLYERVHRPSAPAAMVQKNPPAIVAAPDTREVLVQKMPPQTQRVPQKKGVHAPRFGAGTQVKLAKAAAATTREQFSVPEPLSGDERAILLLAQTNPQALETLPRDGEEIAITPIDITPLAEIDSSSKGDN